MKKLAPAILFFSLALAFVACEDKTNNPKYVTEAFLKAFTEHRFDDAKVIASSETQEMLTLMKQMMAMIEAKDQPKPEKWEPLVAITCKIAKDTTAVCSCVNTKDPKANDINLVKRKGKWLVKMGKEDMQPKP